MSIQPQTSRGRVQLALQHIEPDRVPVDLLMTPEVWHKLAGQFGLDWHKPSDNQFFDPVWEAVAHALESDVRLLSYDQFCKPPESMLRQGARIEWWDSMSRLDAQSHVASVDARRRFVRYLGTPLSHCGQSERART